MTVVAIAKTTPTSGLTSLCLYASDLVNLLIISTAASYNPSVFV